MTGGWSRREALAVAPAALATTCAPGIAVAGCAPAGAGPRWTEVTRAAAFPGGYGFPVHVAGDGQFVALHPEGAWSSRDGAAWAREPLPPAPARHAYVPLVQHGGATWSLAAVTGDYTGFAFDPEVRRTRDYRAWEVVGRSATLPRLIFASVASFRGELWLFGGFDGRGYGDAIWRSTDGLNWARVATAPWSPRTGPRTLVFRERLWAIGGGTVDGPINSEVWSSADGLAWRREAARLADPEPFGYTPQVYGGRIWLLGANRSGEFASSMLVSENGRDWRAVAAPWSPRGAPATWTAGGRLYLTGGKYSRRGPGGAPVFIYSNDVWAMIA